MAIKVPPEERGQIRSSCIGIIFLAFVLGILTASIVLVSIYANKKPHYYAAIDAVSGLEPAALEQLEFDLTLGVKSRSPFSSECLEPGARVVVTYLGVQIANGSTGAQACAARWKPEQMVQMPVVARGAGARLPASVLPGLAADVRRGVALFDVWLRIPSTPGDDGKLVTCRARRVGGVVEAFSTPCEVLNSEKFMTDIPQDFS